MRDHLAEKVTVAYPHGDRIHPKFHRCLLALVGHDAAWGKRLGHSAPFIMLQTTNLPAARNTIVRAFLEESVADWLCFIDTDQTFDPDILERLVASADPIERPILSALVFAQTSNRSLPVSPAAVVFDGENFVEAREVPDERWWTVACAGCGCLLIHRRVLEDVGAKNADDAFPWFKYGQYNRPLDGEKVPDMMGEDFTFSLRAASLGFPSVVDTTIEAGHLKELELTSAHFWAQLPPDQRPRKLWAVIPVKDRLGMTRDLVGQLDGCGIVIIDNGSGKKTRNWLESQTKADVLDGTGMGIHEMWNLGAEYALSMSPAGCDVAFLNNDLILGDDMLAKLQTALRENDGLAMVSPNYDRRPDDFGDGVEYRTDICADRYDGTGGLAGFAFMVAGELFNGGYRFPTECKWWFGDNDILLAVMASGLTAGIVLDATVEHIDGGGATGDWSDPEMQKQLVADKAAFAARWSGGGGSSGAPPLVGP